MFWRIAVIPVSIFCMILLYNSGEYFSALGCGCAAGLFAGLELGTSNEKLRWKLMLLKNEKTSLLWELHRKYKSNKTSSVRN